MGACAVPRLVPAISEPQDIKSSGGTQRRLDRIECVAGPCGQPSRSRLRALRSRRRDKNGDAPANVGRRDSAGSGFGLSSGAGSSAADRIACCGEGADRRALSGACAETRPATLSARTHSGIDAFQMKSERRSCPSRAKAASSTASTGPITLPSRPMNHFSGSLDRFTISPRQAVLDQTRSMRQHTVDCKSEPQTEKGRSPM